jgi:hypothetical protein
MSDKERFGFNSLWHAESGMTERCPKSWLGCAVLG